MSHEVSMPQLSAAGLVEQPWIVINRQQRGRSGCVVFAGIASMKLMNNTDPAIDYRGTPASVDLATIWSSIGPSFEAKPKSKVTLMSA